MYNKENWIDFESEISKVVQALDKEMIDEDGVRFQLSDRVLYLDDEFMATYFSKYYEENDEEFPTFNEIRDTLYKDMNRLIRALEIYLAEYVEKIECNEISPDIKEIIFETRCYKGETKRAALSNILSFNYTNTYRRLYMNETLQKDFEDFIHGKADISNTTETNNMVLGIDEYLLDDKKNKDVEFIAFKKFYQRIYKETGCKYKEWIEQIREDYFEYVQKQAEADDRRTAYLGDGINSIINSFAARAIKMSECPKNYLYIFGHSLDVTDGDILRDLILNDNVHTTIFYHNKDVMGQQIANLVKVIGQDELIKRTGGSTKTIEFKQQADMVERNV